MPKLARIRLDLRLYDESPEDAVIIKGLENLNGYGVKVYEAKKILFEHFKAAKALREHAKIKDNGSLQSHPLDKKSIGGAENSSLAPPALTISADSLPIEQGEDAIVTGYKKLMKKSGW
jgi:hypothetical protein